MILLDPFQPRVGGPTSAIIEKFIWDTLLQELQWNSFTKMPELLRFFSVNLVLTLGKKFFWEIFFYYHKIEPIADVWPEYFLLIWKIEEVNTFLRTFTNFGQISGQYLVWYVK